MSATWMLVAASGAGKMGVVVALPVWDSAGNALVSFRLAAEAELADLDSRIPLPASLIVVTLTGRVLMVFDRWRRQWELPGGMLEPGESPRQAAVRELAEETGISVTDLCCAAVAEFELRQPTRREYVAIYRIAIHREPRLVVNDEVSDFHWWDPGSPLRRDTSPHDAEISRRVVAASAR